MIETLFIVGFALLSGLGMYYLPTKLTYGTTPLEQIKMYNKCKDNIKALIRKDWEIIRFSQFSIGKGDIGDYQVYVKVANKKINEWTNDFIEFDKAGNILKESLTKNMEFNESITRRNAQLKN